MSFDDPFDSAPLDPAPAEEAQQPEVPAVKVKAAKPAKAAAESDGKVVLTFKGGRDFDAPWIVIHANGLQEAHDFVVGDNASLLAVVMERVQTAGKHFAGSKAPIVAPSEGVSVQPQRAAPQGSQEAPGGEKRFCDHGEMAFKSGISKAGNSYRLFSCTAPRESQCKAQYLK